MDNPYESPAADEPSGKPVRSWLACPHCGREAMGPWKKGLTGPGIRHSCKSCGRGVRLSWMTVAYAGCGALVPIVLLALLAGVFPDRARAIVTADQPWRIHALFLGLATPPVAIAIWAQVRHTPICRRGHQR